jgi:hypothetical protein
MGSLITLAHNADVRARSDVTLTAPIVANVSAASPGGAVLAARSVVDGTTTSVRVPSQPIDVIASARTSTRAADVLGRSPNTSATTTTTTTTVVAATPASPPVSTVTVVSPNSSVLPRTSTSSTLLPTVSALATASPTSRRSGTSADATSASPTSRRGTNDVSRVRVV